MPIKSENYTELLELIQPLVAEEIKIWADQKTGFISVLDIYMQRSKTIFALAYLQGKYTAIVLRGIWHLVEPIIETSPASWERLSAGEIMRHQHRSIWISRLVGEGPSVSIYSQIVFSDDPTTFWYFSFIVIHYAVWRNKGGNHFSGLLWRWP